MFQKPSMGKPRLQKFNEGNTTTEKLTQEKLVTKMMKNAGAGWQLFRGPTEV